MGATVKVRGVTLPNQDWMDALIVEAYRKNDRAVIDGYEFARFGRRVRNRNPKWRRLDKNTWVKWTGTYARNVNTSETSPVLVGYYRYQRGIYQYFHCGSSWIMKSYTTFGGDDKRELRDDAERLPPVVPEAWEIVNE